MLKTFDLNKLFDLHLDPPSSENLPLCRITQVGKGPLITTDVYLTNMEQREWILPTPSTNNKVATSKQPVTCHQKYQLTHSNQAKIDRQLYTPEAPVLDLRGKKVTLTLDLADTFHKLCLCSTDSDQQEESSPNGRRKR